MRIRCLRLALAAAVGCGPACLPAAAQAVSCQTTCPLPPAPTSTPIGTPVTVSGSGHYFDTYTTGTIPLIGQSYEYLCHVCQPTRDTTYCTLNTFPGVFSTMNANRNNVIRLETIFNHSPGHQPCGAPFANEQPYLRRGDKWDLTQLNPQYFKNLEAVVNAAANNNIVVEVTLFNPWDGDWTTGPFYPPNTYHQSQGFTDRSFFITLNNGTDNTKTQQNMNARAAQQLALQAVVMHLKKYPNVIWEVANEPDFFNLPCVTRADVFAWEQFMIGQIVAADPSPADHTKPAHLIELNGHTVDTFAWTPPGPGLPVLAGVESTHYTLDSDPGYYGAITLWQATDPTIVTGRASMPIGFNEGISVPDVIPNHQAADADRADSAVRSEALEFIMHGGALFDGYSLDRTNTGATNLSKELGYLANILYPQGTVGVGWLDGMLPADCNKSGSWCSGILPWGQRDEGNCGGSGANIYWSTIQQPGPYLGLIVGDHLLYVHHGSQLPFTHDGYKAIPCIVSPPDPTKGYHLPGLQYSVQVTGCYQEYWQDPSTGLALAFTTVDRTDTQLHPSALNPTYVQDVLLFVQLLGQGSCSGPAELTASFSYTCNRLHCSFDGSGSTPGSSISAYTWRWGDGTYNNPSGTPQAVHDFGKPGTYVVSLEVGDPAGGFGVSGKQLTVAGQPPSQSFAASCNQLSCTFDGNGSTPGDAPINLYSWTFGDATGSAGAVAPAHSYAGGGSYGVTLTVTDGDGVMASLTQTVAVVGPPMANFTFTCSALTCAFDASSTSGSSPIVTYGWSFGDGTSGSGVAPGHTYGAGGDFTVTLTATDANGQAGVATNTVTVDAPPTARFTVSSANRTCTVHTTSSDTDSTPVSRWLWDWGDGTPTIEPTTPYPWADQTHTYAASGRYTITHTVYDTAGLSGSLQLAVLANTAPVAANDTATTERDLPATIGVLANDTDADGDPLSIASVALQNYPGASYQVVPSGSSWAIKVTPPDTFVGTMTFTYVAADPWGGSAAATVTLTVTQWSVVVDALGEQFSCPQNGSIRIPRGTLLANDYDSAGATLTIVSFDTSVLMGTLDCTTDPTACTYRPPTNAAGYTFFRYTVSDPAGRQDTATVKIYVGSPPYGHPPTAHDDYFTTTMNTAKAFTIQDIVQNDVDADGDTLTVGLQSGARAYGSLTCSTPMYTCTYTPNAGFVGTEHFTYTASDGLNPASTAAINILVLPPTTPTFDVREDVIVTGVNKSVYFSSGLLTNDYLPNGGPETVTGLNTTGLIGTLSCGSTSCTYYPPTNYQGTTTFKYTAVDGHGGTDTAIVKIKVGVANNPPVAVPQTLSTPKNTVLKFSVFQLMQNSYDPDDDPLTVTVYTVTAHLGSLSCGTPNYWCTYTPNANATGADAISYVLSDGAASVTSTVTINITP